MSGNQTVLTREVPDIPDGSLKLADSHIDNVSLTMRLIDINWRPMEDLTKRALAAYFRAGGNNQPDSALSRVETIEGKRYVVLRNVNGILAVYRVKPDGFLKKLVRFPKNL